ncbi:MAG: PD-(D/E)XK nuclease family protein [Pseudomonadota bacterium]
MQTVPKEHDGVRYRWLATAGDQNVLTLTSSRRLARELREAYGDQRYAAGERAWNTPTILHWRDWCEQVAINTARNAAVRVVDDTTARILWEQCLTAALPDSGESAVGVLSMAGTAWQRLNDWNVPLGDVAAATASKEEQVFAAAAERYRQALARSGWLDRSLLARESAKALDAGDVAIPTLTNVAGFDRIPPVVENVLDRLRSQGAEIRLIETAASVDRIAHQPYPDREGELRAAGHWARERLLASPTARVAIVVSDLHAHAERYRRFVIEGFAPGWQLRPNDYRRALNVSLGRALAEYPMMTVALLVLKGSHEGLSSSEVSALLRTPYLQGNSDALATRHDLNLRRFPDRRWSAAALGDLFVRNPSAPAAEGLAEQRFQVMARVAAQSEERRSPANWAAQIDELLCAVGWPGAHALSSAEYQVRNRWRELLNEFSATQPVLSSCTFGNAVARLTRAARDTVFQPESGGEPLQLMGFLEAAGFEFDHLWVAGMEAAQWPPANKPLSLVSRRLQQRHAMPDADPADTLGYGRRVLQRLAASASHVRMTWATHAADHLQAPSPLLSEAPATIADEVVDPGWGGAKVVGEAKLERGIDDAPPAVHESERLHGGSRTVNLQFEEPFQAFAAGRLAVGELQPFEGGLPPRLRGTLLHASTQQLLQDLPTHAAIAGWSNDEVATRIAKATQQGYALHFARADAVLRRLLAIEQARSRDVLREFVAAERERAPYRVLGVESRLELERHGLQLRMRADRVDVRDDGSLTIVDYKSGTPASVLTKDGSPNDYQLVLYAMAQPEEVTSLVLTYLCRPNVEFRAVGIDSGFSAEEWTQAMQRWTDEAVAALAEIAAGDVRLPARARGRSPTVLDVLSRIEERRRES